MFDVPLNLYYHSLLNAARNKDLEERKRLVALIGDSKAVELKKRRNPGDKFTEEDLETLIRYQLKYALTATDLAYIFEINRSTFQKNVKKFLEGREELKKEYEYLMDYNNLKRDNLIGVRRG